MIDQYTIQFLAQLAVNNDREWFNDNRSWYEESLKDFKNFVQDVRKELLKTDEIEKTKIYRIYRDLRFTADKTPYKTHFAAHFTRKGKYRRGGFYLQISAREAMVAGGFWNPNRDDLGFIREGIANDPDPFRKALNHKEISERFGGLSGEELKTAPRGIDRDHPQIDLLRKKQFLLHRSYPPETLFHQEAPKKLAADYTAMIPVFQALTEYLVYDLNGVER